MATDGGGAPRIQGATDPKPSYFVSTTVLKQPGQDRRTPQARLDSNTVPFSLIAGPWQTTGGPGLGYFLIGGIGPRNKLGEGPVALDQALGNDPFVMRFGVLRARQDIGGRDVVYVLFPSSAQRGQPLDAASIERSAGPLLDRFGGVARIVACAASLAS